jgi:hypothetical protein
LSEVLCQGYFSLMNVWDLYSQEPCKSHCISERLLWLFPCTSDNWHWDSTFPLSPVHRVESVTDASVHCIILNKPSGRSPWQAGS